MLEGLRYLFSSRPWGEILRDLADIVVVAYMCYRGLLVLRGTRAMQMGVGLVAFGLLYVIARYAELVTLLNVLSWIATSLILIVVVVFQNDIRRALIRVGSKAWLARSREQETRVIDEVVEAATELARHRIGAIITFERDANLLEFVRSDGIAMDSLVSRELLVSLFLPESLNKTHDGAVLIRDLRIARAGVFFPMPESKVVDSSFGSRHRAAIGITEETDAVVVVVSEERGTITLCYQGSYAANVDGANLRSTLLDQLGHRPRKERGLMGRIGAGFRSGRAGADQEAESTPHPSGPAAAGVEAPASAAAESRGRGGAPPQSVRPPAVTTALKAGGTLGGAPGSGKPTTGVGPGGGGKVTASATGSGTSKASTTSGPPPKASGAVTELLASSASAAAAVARGVSRPMATPTPAISSADSVAPESTMTPAPSRVSKPMPVAKERRTWSDLSGDAEGSRAGRVELALDGTDEPKPGESPTAKVGVEAGGEPTDSDGGNGEGDEDGDGDGPTSTDSPSSVPAVERIELGHGGDEA